MVAPDEKLPALALSFKISSDRYFRIFSSMLYPDNINRSHTWHRSFTVQSYHFLMGFFLSIQLKDSRKLYHLAGAVQYAKAQSSTCIKNQSPHITM